MVLSTPTQFKTVQNQRQAGRWYRRAKLLDDTSPQTRLTRQPDRGIDKTTGVIGHTGIKRTATASGITFDENGHVVSTAPLTGTDPPSPPPQRSAVSVPTTSGRPFQAPVRWITKPASPLARLPASPRRPRSYQRHHRTDRHRPAPSHRNHPVQSKSHGDGLTIASTARFPTPTHLRLPALIPR